MRPWCNQSSLSLRRSQACFDNWASPILRPWVERRTITLREGIHARIAGLIQVPPSAPQVPLVALCDNVNPLMLNHSRL